MLIPDGWVILEIKNDDKIYHKLFSSTRSCWRLNSGIVSIKETEKAYEIIGESSTKYLCKKDSYGIRDFYSIDVLHGTISEYPDNLKELGRDEFLKIISLYSKKE